MEYQENSLSDGAFMRRTRTLFLITALYIFPSLSLHGQFGSLKKVFDTAKSLSELDISEEDERALGEAISEKIRAIYGVQQDEDATRYLTLVGKVVAQKSDRPDLDYRFIILDSDSTNAFAAPGGIIHVTRGALALMNSEAELAGVLAHEIAHVTEKHTIKGLQKLKGIELADDQTSLTGDSGVFDKVVEQATEALLQGFGRAEELEADELGVHFSAACNYRPSGLIDFLESLRGRYSGRSEKAGLFASHPETEERIEKLVREVEKEDLGRAARVSLEERFGENISYEVAEFFGTGAVVEGARGMAQGEKKDGQTESENNEEDGKKEEKKGGFLSRLKNPFGSGEKEERAEVTGSAGARGVDTELGEEAPGNPEVVRVAVSEEDVRQFKEAGGLA